MRRLGLALALLVACGTVTAAIVKPPYANNDLQLLTAYRAKELCSCLFVMNLPESYCGPWTVASPNIATYQIDRDNHAVTTEALLMWGARAHLEAEPRFGCILDN